MFVGKYLNFLSLYKMVSKKYIDAVVKVSEICNEIKVKYLIGGSGALLIHGVRVEPNDIDLIIDPEDYEIGCKTFKEYAVGEIKVEGSFKKMPFMVNDISGEILNFKINSDDLTKILFNGVEVSVNRLDIEYGYYKNSTDKIEKNKEKMKLIEEILFKR